MPKLKKKRGKIVTAPVKIKNIVTYDEWLRVYPSPLTFMNIKYGNAIIDIKADSYKRPISALIFICFLNNPYNPHVTPIKIARKGIALIVTNKNKIDVNIIITEINFSFVIFSFKKR